jgi:hypothetical protein
MRWLLVLAMSAAACGSSEHFTVVTVNARPAVHGATKLEVTLQTDTNQQMDTFELGAHALPVTFSVSGPGHTGMLAVTIDAKDDNDVLVGRGTTQAMFSDDAANVMLDSADFVVNTDFPDDEFLSNDFEANGFQMAATADNVWIATFRNSCSSPCNMFGRRFDDSGNAVSSGLAAGTNAFAITTSLSDGTPTPAVAAAGMSYLAVWDFDDATAMTQGVACRAIDKDGNGSAQQLQVAGDTGTDVVSTTALSNGNYAVTWNAIITDGVVRAAIIRPDCTVANAATTVSQTPGSFAHRQTVSANGSLVMYAWIVNGALHVRIGNNANAFSTADTLLLSPAVNEEIGYVRLAPLGAGWAMFVRRDQTAGTGPGRIELYTVSGVGTVTSGPTLITDKAGSDFDSARSFGVAARGDGIILAVWHACGTNGDGDGCGVFGQVVSPTGMLVGTPFNLATTTKADQRDPSVTALSDKFVAGWADNSGTFPDVVGFAVRARILYIGPNGELN